MSEYAHQFAIFVFDGQIRSQIYQLAYALVLHVAQVVHVFNFLVRFWVDDSGYQFLLKNSGLRATAQETIGTKQIDINTMYFGYFGDYRI